MKLTLEGNSLYLDHKAVGALNFTLSIAERDEIRELLDLANGAASERILDLEAMIADMRKTFDGITDQIEKVVSRLREAVQE